MKQNKVLKSLDELSAELLVFPAAEIVETIPAPPELVTTETKSIQAFQPVQFLTDSVTRAYRGWGINE